MTLRLPADLARALARRAKAERASKSALVREAVSRYLAPSLSPSEGARVVTGRDLLARWSTMPHLTPQEADDFAKDIAAAREAVPPVRSAWE
ncbi:MAG TPA: ribbon-helix-helix protein, CopG family [Gemmatimonadales bacterium]|nr:ribbon-helix-helix protein, CopG family [Gemmatimonadales bacterium]